MKSIYIKYDPYEMITEFKVDGVSLKDDDHADSWLKKVLEKKAVIPLQSWIEPVPSEKWGGLLAYLNEMNDDRFSISFCGRQTDYKDLQASLESQNEKLGNMLKIEYPGNKQRFIMDDSKMKAAIDQVVKVMSEDRFAKLVAESESKALKDKYASMKKNMTDIANKEFRVVFTGIYSSGKSTVINALVGKNILPQAEGTCTDQIGYIKHERGLQYSKVVYIMADGSKKEFSCENGEKTQELVRNASGIRGLKEVNVYVDMSHLCPENLANQFKLVFVDTPGTGSEEGNDISKRSEDTTHIKLTERILSSDDKEMVVLVSDKKTVSTGITEILDVFENQAGEDCGYYNDRFLFVLNQCDTYAFVSSKKDDMTGRQQGLENEVLKFKETIAKKSHGLEERNIDNPRVFPLSAATALAIKIGCNDAKHKPESETELRCYYDAYNMFCDKLTNHGAEYYIHEKIDGDKISDNYLLDRHCDLSELQKSELQEKYDHPEQMNEYFLLHSGILSLETAIKSYIEKYAFPIKMRKLLRSFKSILEELNEETKLCLTYLDNARAGLNSKEEEIEKEEWVKEERERRKKELEHAKKEMERLLEKVGCINTDLPEMNDIRSRYLDMQERSMCFFEKRSDGGLVRDITNEKAAEISKKISERAKGLADEAKDLVDRVKAKKREMAEQYAEEFNKYLEGLKKKGLLNVGTLDIKKTVAYRDIIGDGSFMKYESYARDIDNPNKEHIEMNQGILIFFESLAGSIATIFEPSKVNRVDAEKYKENLFNMLDANVYGLIQDVQTSYQRDVEGMKTGMSDRMSAILRLVAEMEEEARRHEQKIRKDLAEKGGYERKKKKLEENQEFLSNLIEKLKFVEAGRA